MAAVEALGAEVAAKTMSALALAKGFGKSESDGSLSWLVGLDTERAINVNGSHSARRRTERLAPGERPGLDRSNRRRRAPQSGAALKPRIQPEGEFLSSKTK
jgi:hypothetical protein